MQNSLRTVEADPSVGRESVTAGDAGEGARRQKHLLFSLDGEVYGVRIDAIREIIEYGGVGSIPRVPDHVRGVVNLRGNVIPVIDLARRLDRRPGAITKRTSIVIFEVQDEGGLIELGAAVDAVNEVIDIDTAQIAQAPAFGTGLRPEFLEGMAKVDDHFVALLALEAVLDLDELAI